MKKQQPKVFITSDTFFGRPNIAIKRGYSSIEQMNEDMIERWNKKVGKDDVVIHLGNFAWSPIDVDIIDKLNGEIVFIPGDRDEALLMVAEENDAINIASQHIMTHGGIVLSHWPLEVWPGMDKDVYHFHGHTKPNIKTDIKKMNRVNACCDNWSLAPIEISDTIELLKEFK
jgi:calcineurin-like phosphoesterase family protein